MGKVVIGLDIGIASVGWAITNEKTLDIIEHGARLFDTVDSPKDSKLANEKRREMRSARRQKDRRKTLKRDFVKFLIDQKYITNISFDKKGEFVNKFRDLYINDAKFNSELDKKYNGMGVFELRKLGMEQKLDKKELINVLLWYVNHRGFKYEDVSEAEDKELNELKNKFGNESKLPVFIQTEFFQNNGVLNGSLNRIFKHSDYLEELKLIFSKQELPKEFTNIFIDKIFNRQRSFEVGPGSAKAFASLKNVSPFSRFKVVDGKLEEKESMWTDSIGKCTYMHNEDRAPKVCITSEIFNLLNDINNVTISNEKISDELKFKILKKATEIKNNSNATMKLIREEYDLDSNDMIKGYRIDKKGNPLFTQLVSLHSIKKKMDITNPFDLIFKNNKFIEDNIFDKIAIILNKTKLLEKRQDEFKKLGIDTKLSTISFTGFSKTHSLSFKAMHFMIPTLIETSKNQMIIAHENKWEAKEMNIPNGKYINKKWIDEVIDTPTVKRALRQTINVLNAIFDYCRENGLDISDIVIEMARENNNKRVRDNETNRQAYFETFNKQIEDYILGKNFNIKISNNTKNKLWLLEQQKGCDAYTGEKISKDDVLKNPGKYDIDHIIPFSQSFDNSRNNKVLTSQQNNSKKGAKTPFQWLKPSEFNEMKINWKKWYFNSTSDSKIFYSKEKFEHLSTEINFANPENQFGFIQRNLVDTRYTTRKILEVLNKFKDVNNLEYKVKTVNGKMTSFARRMMENKRDNKILIRPKGFGDQFDEKTKKKSRIWHGHHAEDAYIITVLNSYYKQNKAIEKVLSNPEYRYEKFDGTNKEIMAEMNTRYSELISNFDIAREKLNGKMSQTRFSRMITSKVNTKLFNESLYEGKLNHDDGSIDKIIKYSLKDMDKKKASELFNPKNKKFSRNKLLIDQNLFEKLSEIYEIYSEEKYPFYNDGRVISVFHKNKEGETVERIVKNVRYVLQEGKNINEIIFAPNNKNSFYDTMSWTEIRVYKNTKDKFVLLPINALNALYLENKVHYKEEVISSQLTLLNVEKKEFDIIRKNEHIISPEGEISFIVSHMASQNKLEIKPLNRKPSKRDPKTINKGLKGWSKVFVDVLGIKIKKQKLF